MTKCQDGYLASPQATLRGAAHGGAAMTKCQDRHLASPQATLRGAAHGGAA